MADPVACSRRSVSVCVSKSWPGGDAKGGLVHELIRPDERTSLYASLGELTDRSLYSMYAAYMVMWVWREPVCVRCPSMERICRTKGRLLAGRRQRQPGPGESGHETGDVA